MIKEQSNSICISMKLDPNISKESLISILDELLGPNQFVSVRMKSASCRLIALDILFVYCRCLVSVCTENVAFVAFSTEKQADRAIEIFSGCKLMDKTVIADRVLSPEQSKFGMYLANVDPAESVESIKSLCNEAVGESDAVKHVKVIQRHGMKIFWLTSV